MILIKSYIISSLCKMSLFRQYYNTKSEFKNRLDKDKYKDRAAKIIENADPTNNRKFTRWILSNYEKGYNHTLEDIETWMRKLLQKYISLIAKKKLPQKYLDINTIAGLFGDGNGREGLIEILRTADTVTINTAEPRLMHKTDYTSIYIIESREQAIWVGRDTKWCTASVYSSEAYTYYTNIGWLIYIEAGGKKYQLHIRTYQFMDANDKVYKDNDVKMSADLCQFFKTWLTVYHVQDFITDQENYPDMSPFFYRLMAATINAPKNTLGDICAQMYKDHEWSPMSEKYPIDYIPVFISYGIDVTNIMDIFEYPNSFETMLMLENKCGIPRNVIGNLIPDIPSWRFCNEDIPNIIDHFDSKHLRVDFLDIPGLSLSQEQVDKIVRNCNILHLVYLCENNNVRKNIVGNASLDARTRLAKSVPNLPFVIFMTDEEIKNEPLEFGDKFVDNPAKFEFIESEQQFRIENCPGNPYYDIGHSLTNMYNFYAAYTYYRYAKNGKLREFIKKYPLHFRGGLIMHKEKCGMKNLYNAGLDPSMSLYHRW